MQWRGRYHALAKERTILRCERLEPPMSQMVILRRTQSEHIWSGLPQIATVNADVPELSVRANS
jgi:hypothetical protein